MALFTSEPKNNTAFNFFAESSTPVIRSSGNDKKPGTNVIAQSLNLGDGHGTLNLPNGEGLGTFGEQTGTVFGQDVNWGRFTEPQRKFLNDLADFSPKKIFDEWVTSEVETANDAVRSKLEEANGGSFWTSLAVELALDVGATALITLAATAGTSIGGPPLGTAAAIALGTGLTGYGIFKGYVEPHSKLVAASEEFEAAFLSALQKQLPGVDFQHMTYETLFLVSSEKIQAALMDETVLEKITVMQSELYNLKQNIAVDTTSALIGTGVAIGAYKLNKVINPPKLGPDPNSKYNPNNPNNELWKWGGDGTNPNNPETNPETNPESNNRNGTDGTNTKKPGNINENGYNRDTYDPNAVPPNSEIPKHLEKLYQESWNTNIARDNGTNARNFATELISKINGTEKELPGLAQEPISGVEALVHAADRISARTKKPAHKIIFDAFYGADGKPLARANQTTKQLLVEALLPPSGSKNPSSLERAFRQNFEELIGQKLSNKPASEVGNIFNSEGVVTNTMIEAGALALHQRDGSIGVKQATAAINKYLKHEGNYDIKVLKDVFLTPEGMNSQSVKRIVNDAKGISQASSSNNNQTEPNNDQPNGRLFPEEDPPTNNPTNPNGSNDVTHPSTTPRTGSTGNGSGGNIPPPGKTGKTPDNNNDPPGTGKTEEKSPNLFYNNAFVGSAGIAIATPIATAVGFAATYYVATTQLKRKESAPKIENAKQEFQKFLEDPAAYMNQNYQTDRPGVAPNWLTSGDVIYDTTTKETYMRVPSDILDALKQDAAPNPESFDPEKSPFWLNNKGQLVTSASFQGKVIEVILRPQASAEPLEYSGMTCTSGPTIEAKDPGDLEEQLKNLVTGNPGDVMMCQVKLGPSDGLNSTFTAFIDSSHGVTPPRLEVILIGDGTLLARLFQQMNLNTAGAIYRIENGSVSAIKLNQLDSVLPTNSVAGEIGAVYQNVIRAQARVVGDVTSEKYLKNVIQGGGAKLTFTSEVNTLARVIFNDQDIGEDGITRKEHQGIAATEPVGFDIGMQLSDKNGPKLEFSDALYTGNVFIYRYEKSKNGEFTPTEAPLPDNYMPTLNIPRFGNVTYNGNLGSSTDADELNKLEKILPKLDLNQPVDEQQLSSYLSAINSGLTFHLTDKLNYLSPQQIRDMIVLLRERLVGLLNQPFSPDGALNPNDTIRLQNEITGTIDRFNSVLKDLQQRSGNSDWLQRVQPIRYELPNGNAKEPSGEYVTGDTVNYDRASDAFGVKLSPDLILR